MKMQINELAALCGVSVRTLHYYDEIGLLPPAFVDGQNGYRFYDEGSLERMQEILYYRELDFPLKSIAEILSSPNYNKQNAISRQKHLLTLKKERLERLISALEAAENGGYTMSFQEFDSSEYEAARKAYEKEAKEKWGDTDAYREYEKKHADCPEDKRNGLTAEMDGFFAEFAKCKESGAAPESEAAEALVKKWQAFISDNFYNCTKEILSGLGEMYLADDRFKSNIDRHGDGTAEFMAKAIKNFCR